MTRRKALIVDPVEEFRTALARALEPDFSTVCCSRGDEALEVIAGWKPQVLILDLDLPGLDGISLLRQLEDRPPVLVMTDMPTPFVRSALEELGVQYAIRKPCSVQNVADRAFELSLLPADLADDGKTAALLMALSLPIGRQGYQHLLTGLPLLSRNRDQRLSKELYAVIAARSSTNSGSVEKAIRDVIRAGWAAGDRAVWQQYFPGLTRCPRNKEFLFRLADLLRQQRCG